MTTDDEHREALTTAIVEAMDGYLRRAGSVPADVVQAALGYIVTCTFGCFTNEAQRLHMLDSFCDILRETVLGEDEDDDDNIPGKPAEALKRLLS